MAEAALELQKGRKQCHGSNAFPNIGQSLPFRGMGWAGSTASLCSNPLGQFGSQDSFLLCDCSLLGQCGGVIGAELKAFLLFFCMVFWH